MDGLLDARPKVADHVVGRERAVVEGEVVELAAPRIVPAPRASEREGLLRVPGGWTEGRLLRRHGDSVDIHGGRAGPLPRVDEVRQSQFHGAERPGEVASLEVGVARVASGGLSG